MALFDIDTWSLNIFGLKEGRNARFIEAARDGNVAEVQKFIQQRNIDLDARLGEQNWTALHYALENGHNEVAIVLLEAGANPALRSTPTENISPLGIAARNRNTDLVNQITRTLQRRYASDVDGLITALTEETAVGVVPAQTGNTESQTIIRRAISDARVARGRPRDFLRAIDKGNVYEVRGHVERGAIAIDVTWAETSQKTGLFRASEHGHAELIDILLSANANPDVRTSNNESSLSEAVKGGYSTIAARIIESLAILHADNPIALIDALTHGQEGGRSPLNMSVAISDDANRERIEKLVTDAARRIIDGDMELGTHQLGIATTPMQFAVNSGNVELTNHVSTRLRTQHAKDPERLYEALTGEGEHGYSPLRSAQRLKNDELERAISNAITEAERAVSVVRVQRGLDIDFVKAAENGRLEEVRAFIDAGSVNLEATRGRNNWNALLLAASNGHDEVVEVLLEAGLNPDSRSGVLQNTSPVMVAIDGSHDAIATRIITALQEQYGDDPMSLLRALTHIDNDNHTPIELACSKANGSIRELIHDTIQSSAERIIADGTEFPEAALGPLTPLQFAAHTGNLVLVNRELEKLQETYAESPDRLVRELVKEGIQGLKPEEIARAAGGDEAAIQITAVLQETKRNMTREGAALREDRTFLNTAKSGNVRNVRAILERGVANLDARDGRSRITAIYRAAYNGHDALATYLLEQGAHPGLHNDKGYSPLNAALLRKHPQIAEELVAGLRLHLGESPDELLAALSNPDQHNNIPLERANKNGYINCANQILDGMVDAIAAMDMATIRQAFNRNVGNITTRLQEEQEFFNRVFDRLREDPERLGVVLAANLEFMMGMVDDNNVAVAREVVTALGGNREALELVLGAADKKRGTVMHYAIAEEKLDVLSVFTHAGVVPSVMHRGKTVAMLALEEDCTDVFLALIGSGAEVIPDENVQNTAYMKRSVVMQCDDKDGSYQALEDAARAIKHIPKPARTEAFGAYIKIMAMADAIAENCDPKHLTRDDNGTFYVSPIFTQLIRNSKGDWVDMAKSLDKAQAKMVRELHRREEHQREAEVDIAEIEVECANAFTVQACHGVKDMMGDIVRLWGLPILPISLQNLVQEIELTDTELETLIEDSIPDIAGLLIAGKPIPGSDNLNMQGMSLERILEHSFQWHRNQEFIDAQTTEVMPEGTWHPIIIGKEVEITEGAMRGGKIININSGEELSAEGRAMKHCIGSYRGSAMAGNNHFFSFVDAKGNRVGSLQLKVKNEGTSRNRARAITIPGSGLELSRGQFQAHRNASVSRAAEDGFQFLKRGIESGTIPVQLVNRGRTGRPQDMKKDSVLYETIGTYTPDTEKWENGYQAIMEFTATNNRTRFLVSSSYRNPDKVPGDRQIEGQRIRPVEAFAEDSGFANAMYARLVAMKPEIEGRFSRVAHRIRSGAVQELAGAMAGMEVGAAFLKELKSRGLSGFARALDLSNTEPSGNKSK